MPHRPAQSTSVHPDCLRDYHIGPDIRITRFAIPRRVPSLVHGGLGLKHISTRCSTHLLPRRLRLRTSFHIELTRQGDHKGGSMFSSSVLGGGIR
jgi:hypothetical protein